MGIKLKMRKGWNKKRVRQLGQLRSLMIECVTLNSGSGTIERMQRIVRFANQLFEWKERDLSFISWIEALPWEEDTTNTTPLE